MESRLPSLKALRVFEAAARHLKFVKAAEELHVTPGAVSQQIRALEEELGVALFHRCGRDISLTETGRRVFDGVHDALGLIGRTINDALKLESQGALSVTVGPAFAVKWLAPRIHRFYEMRPDINVQLFIQTEPIELETLKTDMAIRFGNGVYPGYHVTFLFKEKILPMCSPKLLEGPWPLRTPDDLKHHVLLHTWVQDNKANTVGWAEWLEYAGVKDIDPEKGLFLETIDRALQAAVDGAGVVLGFCRLADADIRGGRLVLPFTIGPPSDRAYYVVCPNQTAARPKIAAFRDWLLNELANDCALDG